MTNRLIIDTRNGIAGDIACAGLISLGADPVKVSDAMEFAGSRIGRASVIPVFSSGTVSLEIDLTPHEPHLYETSAREKLDLILSELSLPVSYRDLGMSILDSLCIAERHVHATDPQLRHMQSNHHPRPDNLPQPDDPDPSSHHHTHKPTPKSVNVTQSLQHEPHPVHNELQAVLHESQDILCDITGFVVGCDLLSIESVHYLDHVSVGSGTISFSHGTFEVPAPATRYLLENHGIPWKRSQKWDREMATPTGISLLTGSGARQLGDLKGFKDMRTGLARGTHPELPPIQFHLVEM